MGFAKQSFAPKWVPKLELGNQKKPALPNAANDLCQP
jgi:hypothetical protein